MQLSLMFCACNGCADVLEPICKFSCVSALAFWLFMESNLVENFRQSSIGEVKKC